MLVHAQSRPMFVPPTPLDAVAIVSPCRDPHSTAGSRLSGSGRRQALSAAVIDLIGAVTSVDAVLPLARLVSGALCLNALPSSLMLSSSLSTPLSATSSSSKLSKTSSSASSLVPAQASSAAAALDHPAVDPTVARDVCRAMAALLHHCDKLANGVAVPPAPVSTTRAQSAGAAHARVVKGAPPSPDDCVPGGGGDHHAAIDRSLLPPVRELRAIRLAIQETLNMICLAMSCGSMTWPATQITSEAVNAVAVLGGLCRSFILLSRKARGSGHPFANGETDGTVRSAEEEEEPREEGGPRRQDVQVVRDLLGVDAWGPWVAAREWLTGLIGKLQDSVVTASRTLATWIHCARVARAAATSVERDGRCFYFVVPSPNEPNAAAVPKFVAAGSAAPHRSPATSGVAPIDIPVPCVAKRTLTALAWKSDERRMLLRGAVAIAEIVEASFVTRGTREGGGHVRFSALPMPLRGWLFPGTAVATESLPQGDSTAAFIDAIERMHIGGRRVALLPTSSSSSCEKRPTAAAPSQQSGDVDGQPFRQPCTTPPPPRCESDEGEDRLLPILRRAVDSLPPLRLSDADGVGSPAASLRRATLPQQRWRLHLTAGEKSRLLSRLSPTAHPLKLVVAAAIHPNESHQAPAAAEDGAHSAPFASMKHPDHIRGDDDLAVELESCCALQVPPDNAASCGWLAPTNGRFPYSSHGVASTDFFPLAMTAGRPQGDPPHLGGQISGHHRGGRDTGTTAIRRRRQAAEVQCQQPVFACTNPMLDEQPSPLTDALRTASQRKITLSETKAALCVILLNDDDDDDVRRLPRGLSYHSRYLSADVFQGMLTLNKEVAAAWLARSMLLRLHRGSYPGGAPGSTPVRYNQQTVSEVTEGGNGRRKSVSLADELAETYSPVAAPLLIFLCSGFAELTEPVCHVILQSKVFYDDMSARKTLIRRDDDDDDTDKEEGGGPPAVSCPTRRPCSSPPPVHFICHSGWFSALCHHGVHLLLQAGRQEAAAAVCAGGSAWPSGGATVGGAAAAVGRKAKLFFLLVASIIRRSTTTTSPAGIGVATSLSTASSSSPPALNAILSDEARIGLMSTALEFSAVLEAQQVYALLRGGNTKAAA